MAKQLMPIVNASGILTEREVRAAIPALQVQIDRDFLPAWRDQATPVELSFLPIEEIPNIPADAWPIFLNRHSQDPGALGWHTDEAKIYGRVFVGDCKAFGISWTVDLSHEILETLVDPTAQKVWRMPDGRFAALEVCDAVEADALGYAVSDGQGGTIMCSDFVLPAYFGADTSRPFDHQRMLAAGCPELTPGGYMSVCDANGQWTLLQADQYPGVPGRRFLMGMNRHRPSRRRKNADPAKFIIING